MAGHLSEPLPLGRIARHVGVSVPHLVRLFARGAGAPPHAALRAMRLMRAAELLDDPKLAVKEVAGQVGCRDSSDFARDFGRFHGESPLAYRRRRQRLDLHTE